MTDGSPLPTASGRFPSPSSRHNSRYNREVRSPGDVLRGDRLVKERPMSLGDGMGPAGRSPSRPRPIRFGKYVLVEKLAQGGMAEIFRAVLTGPAAFAKTVALKRILPGYGDLPDFRERFIEEARLAADLVHSNIAQVLEFGELDDSYF